MRIVLLRNVSSSLAQQLINQLFGGVVFFLLSGAFGKAVFGDLNWCLAILLTGFGVLGFGLDQLAVRKVAAGEPGKNFLPQYAFHVLVAGGIFYAALLLLSHGTIWLMFACLGGGKLLVFWSSPFKQVAAGKEKFPLLAAMSVCSSVLKGVGLVAMLCVHQVGLHNILYLFLSGDAAEFVITLLLYRLCLRGTFGISRGGYKGLLREALPQIGVVLSTSAMARFDWILIGWLLSDVFLADYSFAYKVFELSTLPLLAIAPLLIPRFTRHRDEPLGTKFLHVLRVEMIVCGLVMVLVNVAWTPVIGWLTNGKFGAGEAGTVFLLSLCTPLIYLNNFLWTILFAKANLKAIFRIIGVTCLVNLALDLALIPWLHNEGAALAYLVALVVQSGMYLREVPDVARKLSDPVRNFLGRVDGPLLLFLFLFLDVKMVVKLAALLLMYCLRPDFRFGIRLKASRIPLFYLAMPAVALVDGLVYKNLNNALYIPVLLYGMGIWLMCLLAFHQVRLSIESHPPAVIHRTLVLFFVANALFSLAQLGYIMWDSGSFNPYRYQGMFQKYFIGTGDLIKGITLDTSTTNAVFNAIGVIYFLMRGKFGLTLLCMATLLLTASNCTNIFLLGALVLMGITSWTDRVQKSVILLCAMLFIVFMTQVSPQNDDYATDIVYQMMGMKRTPPSGPAARSPKEKFAQDYLDSLSAVQYLASHPGGNPVTAGLSGHNPSGRPHLAQDDINSAPFQRLYDTTAGERALLRFESREGNAIRAPRGMGGRWPGKVIAFEETIRFLRSHPGRALTGDGVGNFSSKLAFRTTGLDLYGDYPARLAYIHPDFLANHFSEYCYFFSRDIEVHSVVNTPDSVYNQILGEYGLLGLCAFVLGYVAFFAKGLRKRSYGWPLLVLLCCVLAMGYWFEQLSVVVLFECLLLTDQMNLWRPEPQS